MIKMLIVALWWRIGKSAIAGDIQMFYNSILFSKEYWKFQQILIKENLDIDKPTTVAVIVTLIYRVCSVANQCEEVIKLLADKIKEMYPQVTTFLLHGCYVDDLGGSTPSNQDSNKLIAESLGSISMKIKGWAVSGSDPPKELSDDGVSIPFAGLNWYPKSDFCKLNIQ